MANKQTRRLLKLGKSLKFNHGVDHTGADHSDRPEISIIERPLFRGTECVTMFGAKGFTGNRRHAYSAPTVTKGKSKGAPKKR
jgi:hypothetical protein